MCLTYIRPANKFKVNYYCKYVNHVFLAWVDVLFTIAETKKYIYFLHTFIYYYVEQLTGMLFQLVSVSAKAVWFVPQHRYLCFSTELKRKKKKNRYFTKHIKLQAQIHYQTMHDPLRFLQRIYWQTSSAACFIERELQRFYYIIMYHHHLLYCWWDRCPLTARLSTRYQAVMQILQNNVATAKWNRPHITMYGFHLQEFHNMAIN